MWSTYSGTFMAWHRVGDSEEMYQEFLLHISGKAGLLEERKIPFNVSYSNSEILEASRVYCHLCTFNLAYL